MDYKKGDRIKHPTRDDWGLGEVLEVKSDKTVRVFFVGAGEKTLLSEHVTPTKVTGDAANHPILDNLRVTNSSTGVKYQSLGQSIQIFLERFPEGFYGEKFSAHERAYKEEAHDLAQELLSKEPLERLLQSEDYANIVSRAMKVLNRTNLVFPNEKMSLKDGLASTSNQKAFSKKLFSLLHGEEDLETSFMSFATFLEDIDAAKWTTASYFLFITQPDKYMFVKPTITQHAATLCAFEINYKPQLNWLTYNSVLSLSDYLFSEISELKPRDMIDVQSFMWCIAPGKYGAS